jgi:hypothetical protein
VPRLGCGKNHKAAIIAEPLINHGKTVCEGSLIDLRLVVETARIAAGLLRIIFGA